MLNPIMTGNMLSKYRINLKKGLLQNNVILFLVKLITAQNKIKDNRHLFIISKKNYDVIIKIGLNEVGSTQKCKVYFHPVTTDRLLCIGPCPVYTCVYVNMSYYM